MSELSRTPPDRKPEAPLPALRRRLPPLPIDVVLTAPGMPGASREAFRSALTLASLFWAGHCAPLPDADSDLAIAAKTSLHRWRKYRAEVMAILGPLLPILVVEFDSARRCKGTASRRTQHQVGGTA